MPAVGKGAAKAASGALVLAFGLWCLLLLASVWDIALPYFQGDVNPYHPDQPGTQSTGERIFYFVVIGWNASGW